MVGSVLVDRYVLDEKLATGGMGSVFRATDTRLQRSVALKLMKQELAADARFVERFRREARSAGALSHPNIAGVFDYGEDAHQHFIVMELVEGRDLGRVLREEGPLSEDRAGRIAAQIADALDHAHAAGVIHRDIKPENVIVGSNDRIKVTDFGIARAQADASLTATGSFLGTAQYISPEQASGADVTPASDIYSLGIVLFEMLTGAVPFTADSAVAVATRHLTDRVPAPSSVRPDITPAMDAVVMTATAREPEDRFPDAPRFAAAAREAIVGKTTSEAPAGTTHPLPTAAASTAVISSTTRADTRPDEWPFPAHPPRWEPRKLGQIVLGIFVALLLVAAALVLYRLADRGDRSTAEPRREGDARAIEPPEKSQVDDTALELPSFAGRTYEDAAAELEAVGLIPERVEDFSDEYESGLIFASEPAAGSRISEGETVTLFVSKGPAEEDQSDEDEEESSEGQEGFTPPGQAKKDKGKDD